MPSKDRKARQATRGQKRDRAVDTEELQIIARQRELNRARQERHRDKLRSAEGALGLEGMMTPRDRARSQAFGRELARLATAYRGYGELREARPKVPALRERLLDGKTLSLAAGRKLLIEQSIYFLSRERFRELGAPITARVVSHDELPMEITSKGVTSTWRLTLRWGEHSAQVDVAWTRRHRDRAAVLSPIGAESWNDIWGGDRRALPGSVMAELLELAKELERAYLWDQEEALLFILTGLPPDGAAIKLSSVAPEWRDRDHAQARLIVKAQPWVSTQSVARIYRMFQKHYFAPSKRRVSKPPREASLVFFDFVAPLWHAGRSWREMCNEWNTAHPDDAYAPEAIRNFQRDFKAIYMLMMGVDVKITGGRPGRPRGSKNKPGPRSGSRAAASLSTGENSGKGLSAATRESREAPTRKRRP